MTLSWLAFGILVAGAGGFAAWIYVRRELPIPGRGLLGTIRALILGLVLLLLWDPRLPLGPRSDTSEGSWVLLDVSASMSARASAGVAEGSASWAAALERAGEFAEAGARSWSSAKLPRLWPSILSIRYCPSRLPRDWRLLSPGRRRPEPET